MRNVASLARAILRAGSAMIALAAPAAIQAQSAPAVDAGNETIVVTGFRASIQNSISEKRDSPIIVDVVSADDIAGLPDVSIAESLARLPGVAAQRGGGQASAINIRGLTPDLVSASLNGREQVATSGLRTIEFEQYPSELLSQAAVYKSPMASLIEGGIAGRVELKTARPLDQDQPFSATLNVRGSYNDRAHENPDANKMGYRISAGIQAKFLDDRLGIALGYARMVQPNVATRFKAYDYVLTGNNGAGNRLDLNNNGIRDAISYGFELIQFGGTETRDGALGVIQFEPTPSTRILLDGYYSRFRSDVRRRGVRFGGMQNGNTLTGTLKNPVLAGDAIIGGTWISGNGAYVESVNQDESDRDRLYTLGGNLAQDLGDRVTVSFDASYSTANSYFYNSGVTVSAYARNSGGALVPIGQVPGALVVDYMLNGLETPDIRINHDFTNPETNRFQGFYIVPQEDDDSLQAYAANLEWRVDGPFVKSVQFGGRYSKRRAFRTVTTFDQFGIPASVSLPSDLYKGAGFSGDFATHGFPNFLAVDIDGLLDRFVGEDREARQDYPYLGFTYDQSFRIDEKIVAGFVQMNFETVAGGLPFSGNIGVRMVHTDQSSTSSLDDPTNPDPNVRYYSTFGDKYTQFLPSANMVLDVSDRDRLRLSLSRQISRPRFYELRNAIGFSIYDIGGGKFRPIGSGGNPMIRPYAAKQVDFTYERYLGTTGIFALGLFYKELENLITGGMVEDFDYRAAGLFFPPLPSNAPPGSVVLDKGPLYAPINGNGGNVWGIEAQFTQSFRSLPAPFDGLGVTMNYAFTQSSVSVTSNASGNTFNLPMIGLSKHVFNPTVFYDKNGFAARVGVRYRSGFVASHFGFDEQITGNAPETVVDAQLSYAFPDTGALKGLTIYLQGNNLTDAPTRSYYGSEAQTDTLQHFGRVFYFGASMRF